MAIFLELFGILLFLIVASGTVAQRLSVKELLWKVTQNPHLPCSPIFSKVGGTNTLRIWNLANFAIPKSLNQDYSVFQYQSGIYLENPIKNYSKLTKMLEQTSIRSTKKLFFVKLEFPSIIYLMVTL